MSPCQSANAGAAEGEPSCIWTALTSDQDAAGGARICRHGWSPGRRHGAAVAKRPQRDGEGDSTLQKNPGQPGQVGEKY